MRDEVWWLLIGITLFAVVFSRLLALWNRHRVRRKLLRTLMSLDGGSRFIKASHHKTGDKATNSQPDFSHRPPDNTASMD